MGYIRYSFEKKGMTLFWKIRFDLFALSIRRGA